MCSHVLPPSSERYTPLPIETLLRIQLSPVPTHTMLWFDGATAIAPIDCTGCESKIGVQWNPPSVDFQTPPDAAPA